MNPPLERENGNQLFVFVAMMDKHGRIIYVDNTGNFPIHSIDGMQTVFTMYDWSSNEILAATISDTTDETMVKAFKSNITYLSKRGLKPVINITNNNIIL